jgi:hypothetical protein
MDFKVIDFDWAGELGIAKYPAERNKQIPLRGEGDGEEDTARACTRCICNCREPYPSKRCYSELKYVINIYQESGPIDFTSGRIVRNIRPFSRHPWAICSPRFVPFGFSVLASASRFFFFHSVCVLICLKSIYR